MATPSTIYAIQAYSKTLNSTVREFDEDSLNYRHTPGHAQRLAQQKADSLAARLNAKRHKGATDWTASIQLVDYKPDATARGSQIVNPKDRWKNGR